MSDLGGWCVERGIRAPGARARGGGGGPGGAGAGAGGLAWELLEAPPRTPQDWERLGPLLVALAAGSSARDPTPALAVASALDQALRVRDPEGCSVQREESTSVQLAALALLEALATNSMAFRRGCGIGSGSATECLAAAVHSAAEAATGLSGLPRKGRGLFSKKKSQSVPGGSGRVPQGARLVLQSFQARALQASSRGAADPFYEAFVTARPTARAWAVAAGAAVPEEETPSPFRERQSPSSPTSSLGGNLRGRQESCPRIPAGDALPAGTPDLTPFGVSAPAPRGSEGREGHPEVGKGLLGKDRAFTGRTRSQNPSSSGEDGGGTDRGKRARHRGPPLAEATPSAPSHSKRSSSEEPGEVDALCGYLRALSSGGGSPRPVTRSKLSGAAGDSSAARLRLLLAERESIRGALGRLEGVLHALRSIESRAGAAKWAASVGEQTLRDAPSPRRGALAAACLKSI